MFMSKKENINYLMITVSLYYEAIIIINYIFALTFRYPSLFQWDNFVFETCCFIEPAQQSSVVYRLAPT